MSPAESLLRMAFLGLLGLNAQPLQAEVWSVAPSSKWVVEYADDSCRLSRSFGIGDDQVILVMDQYEPGDTFSLIFAGKRIVPRRQVSPMTALIRFGPHEAASDILGMPGEAGGHRAFIVTTQVRLAAPTEAQQRAWKEPDRGVIEPPIGETRERAATWLELNDMLRQDLRLETGPMDKPLAALRACSWDTVKLWGLGVEQQKNRSRKPYSKVPSSAWFRVDEYPERLLDRGYQGKINFRVMIDEKGKIESCHIQESTRPKEFDDLVCRSVMRRARFEPALDAQGKPIRSYWRQTVTYRIG